MKPFSPLTRRAKFAGAGALLLVALTLQGQAQSVSIFTASYGADPGGAAQATGTFDLNPFTVENVYTAGNATTESVFITDGTANGVIFGTQAALASLTPGVTATATITDSLFHGEEEFKTPTNIAVTGTGTSATHGALLSMVAATLGTANTANPFTAGPSDSLYASEGALLFAPVSFTITPNASGTLSTTTVTSLVDVATGNTVSVFKSVAAFPFTAGVTYTVTGVESPFPVGGVTESEIVNASSLVAAPEPSTNVLLGLGSVAACLVGARLRRPSQV